MTIYEKSITQSATYSTVSPFNPQSTATKEPRMVFNAQNIPSVSVRNEYVAMKSALFSHSNGALFMNGRPATTQSLVPQIAKAWVQTVNELVSAKNDGYRNRMHEQLSDISQVMAQFNIRRECCEWATLNTPYRG